MSTLPNDGNAETPLGPSEERSGKRRVKLDIPAFLKPLPGEPEEVWVAEEEDGPLPPETDDAFPCWKGTPKWEGEGLSPCIVEVRRFNAWRAEHGAICRQGLDRLEQAWRDGAFVIVTAHCHCGASKDITHYGHH
jgi:hypothetical protein